MTGGPAGDAVIRLSSAAYTYRGPPPVAALKPTSMVIYRGEHVAITGPSGSGKSTLLNLLGLLDKPTQGTIEIDGIDVGAAPERERAAVRAHHIGFVFQSFHLLPYRTSIENVMLAQVYADEPREPTGNLDTATTDELSDLLESLHRAGATLVVITHNPAVASRAQRQIAIRDGELTEISGATTPPVTGTPGPPGSGAPQPLPPPSAGPPPADRASGDEDTHAFPDE
jgi:putative ABC transport system ATP-binding protein